MFTNRVSKGVRCALLVLMLLGGSYMTGCGSNQNEINIPQKTLPLPGPNARLGRRADQSVNESEQVQSAP